MIAQGGNDIGVDDGFGLPGDEDGPKYHGIFYTHIGESIIFDDDDVASETNVWRVEGYYGGKAPMEREVFIQPLVEGLDSEDLVPLANFPHFYQFKNFQKVSGLGFVDVEDYGTVVANVIFDWFNLPFISDSYSLCPAGQSRRGDMSADFNIHLLPPLNLLTGEALVPADNNQFFVWPRLRFDATLDTALFENGDRGRVRILLRRPNRPNQFLDLHSYPVTNSSRGLTAANKPSVPLNPNLWTTPNGNLLFQAVLESPDGSAIDVADFTVYLPR